jgi:hypothetical protein
VATNNQFAYVQARLQARHGQRPSEDRWRLLESSPDLASYLQGARSTALRPWVMHLPSESNAHQVERSVRGDWEAYVGEVSAWVPPPWRAGVDWFATLPYLPFFVHLVRGEPVPGWMRDDASLGHLATEDLDRRREALAASVMGGIAQGLTEGAAPMVAWLNGWAATWPAVGAGVARSLLEVRTAFERHDEEIRLDPANSPAGPRLRRPLLARLNTLFRRHSGQIAAVFAHIGLMSLDLERMRGGLVIRALFPEPTGRPQWA